MQLALEARAGSTPAQSLWKLHYSLVSQDQPTRLITAMVFASRLTCTFMNSKGWVRTADSTPACAAKQTSAKWPRFPPALH